MNIPKQLKQTSFQINLEMVRQVLNTPNLLQMAYGRDFKPERYDVAVFWCKLMQEFLIEVGETSASPEWFASKLITKIMQRDMDFYRILEMKMEKGFEVKFARAALKLIFNVPIYENGMSKGFGSAFEMVEKHFAPYREENIEG